MEGIASVAYFSFKAYLRRKGYNRLNSKDTPSDLPTPLALEDPHSKRSKTKRRFRIRRPRLKLGRLRFKLGAIRKLFMKIRDSYVNTMQGVANQGITNAGYGGFIGGGRIDKEYDEKLVVEIYKRIIWAQQQKQQEESHLARRIGCEVTPVCLFG